MLPIKITEEEVQDWQSILSKLCNGNYKKSRINKRWYKSESIGGLRFLYRHYNIIRLY